MPVSGVALSNKEEEECVCCCSGILRYISLFIYRYGLFDFEYMHQCQGTSESSKKQKLFLMSWCPDTAKVRIGHFLLFFEQLSGLLIL